MPMVIGRRDTRQYGVRVMPLTTIAYPSGRASAASAVCASAGTSTGPNAGSASRSGPPTCAKGRSAPRSTSSAVATNTPPKTHSTLR